MDTLEIKQIDKLLFGNKTIYLMDLIVGVLLGYLIQNINHIPWLALSPCLITYGILSVRVHLDGFLLKMLRKGTISIDLLNENAKTSKPFLEKLLECANLLLKARVGGAITIFIELVILITKT